MMLAVCGVLLRHHHGEFAITNNRSSLGGTFLSAHSRCLKNTVLEEKLGRAIKHFGTKK